MQYGGGGFRTLQRTLSHKINLDKSAMDFNPYCAQSVIEDIQNLLFIRNHQSNGRFLRLSIMIGKSKYLCFSSIKEMV